MLRRNLLKLLSAIISLSFLNFKVNNSKKDVKMAITHPDGRWEEKFYNNKNQLTYYENSNGYWEKFEYNEQNQILKYINSQGYLYKFTSDFSGVSFFYQDSLGWCEYKYFKNKSNHFYKDSSGYYYEDEYSDSQVSNLISLHQKSINTYLTDEKIDRQQIITYPINYNNYANNLNNFLNRKKIIC